jgi:uncharacterized protein (DUF2342 family)
LEDPDAGLKFPETILRVFSNLIENNVGFRERETVWAHPFKLPLKTLHARDAPL